MNKKLTLTAVVITQNEEKKIGDCLKSLEWIDEVIVIDNNSIDKTVSIAKRKGAFVFKIKDASFSASRNKGLKKAKGDWIIYVDADERVTPMLREEIKSIIKPQRLNGGFSTYAISRKNIILGKEMKHGGWWPDYVKRLFKKTELTGWKGKLHEEPVYKGKLGYLKSPFIHLKHDNLSDMVKKTNKWSEIEAKLLLKSNHPKMTWWRFIRIMLSEIWLRLIVLRGFLDGGEGIIYSFYQGWSKFLTYAKLWEMQYETKDKKVS